MLTKPREKSFPYEDTEPEAHAALASKLYTLTWGGEGEDVQARPLGYMLERVVDELVAAPPEIRGPVHVDRERRTVRAFEDGAGAATEAARTATVAALMRYWREKDTFECLRGWRDELWPGTFVCLFGWSERPHCCCFLFYFLNLLLALLPRGRVLNPAET